MQDCVKLVTFIVLVGNRFILAAFCCVFVSLFMEYVIGVFPLIWRIGFFGKGNMGKNRLQTCFEKTALIIFPNRSWLNKMCCLST